MFQASTVSADLNLSYVIEHLCTSFTRRIPQSFFMNAVQVKMYKSDDAFNDSDTLMYSLEVCVVH